MRARVLPVLFAVLVTLPASAEEKQAGEATDSGVRARWSYAARAADGLGILEVATTDAETGRPIAYARGDLLVWLQKDRSALSDLEAPCADRIRNLASRGFGRRTDIDVNEHRVMTLNSDGSLAIINPEVAFNNAKLESIIDIGGSPKGWLSIPERAEAWVVTDDPPQLVAIDLQARAVSRRLAMPPHLERDNARAIVGEMAYDVAGDALWLTLPSAGGFGMVDFQDPRTPRLVAAPDAIGVAAAPELAGAVTLEANGRVALRRGAALVHEWRVSGTPIAAEYSVLSRQIVVANREGSLFWLDPEKDSTEPVRGLALGHGARLFALFDGGRRALAVGDGKATVVDLATASLVTTAAAPKSGDQLILTARFAYTLDSASGRASAWLLSDLRAGRAVAAEVTVSEPDPGADVRTSSLRLGAPSPEGAGLLVASPPAGRIFAYQEGMMASSGSLSNYRRAPLALAILDPSLRPVAEGRYQTAVRPESSGRYWLMIGGTRPRFSLCARVTLPRPANQAEDSPDRYRAILADAPPARPDEPPAIRIRLQRVGGDGSVAAQAGVSDLTLLLFDRRSGWQQRVPMRETAAGEYEAAVQVPEPGTYEALASSVSANLPYLEGRIGSLSLGGGR